MSGALKLTGGESPRRVGAGGSVEAGESVGAVDMGAWLEVVVRLSGLPEGERGQIRDELRDHLEGRVRDLMLTGREEGEATAEAIGELGDAAELARNLRAAARPRRSMTMAMCTAVLAAGVALAAVVWQPGSHPAPVSVFEPSRAPEAAPAAGAKVAVREGGTWREFFDSAGAAAKLPVVVNWRAMGEMLGEDGELSGRPVGAEFKDLTLPTAVAMVNDARGLRSVDRLDWRVVDGTLVFSSASFFDRQETVLVTYDLGGMPGIEVGGEAGTMEQVKSTIVKMVEPEAWAEGGGSGATMTEVGTKLFVRAPKRLQAGVEWVLAEVQGKKAAGEASQTRVYAMQRVSAEQAAGLLRVLWGDGAGLEAATADARTNAVVVKGPERVLAEAGRVLRGMDEVLKKPEEREPGKGAALPENVRLIVGPGEIVSLSHADAGEVAAMVARRMVEWSRETGAGRWVVEARGGGVLVAGEAGPRARAEAMVRELDAAVGRAGREEGLGAGATMAGLRRTSVPVLGEVPILSNFFRNEEPAPLVIRSAGGLIRVTAPDGTSVETEEIRVSPGGR